jgi:hypothetical protein
MKGSNRVVPDTCYPMLESVQLLTDLSTSLRELCVSKERRLREIHVCDLPGYDAVFTFSRKIYKSITILKIL